MATTHRLSCGLDFSTIAEIKETLDTAGTNGFDFSMLLVVHPHYKREFSRVKSKDHSGAFTRSDMIRASQEWCQLVVGKISPYLDCESDDKERHNFSEMILTQELAYSVHLDRAASSTLNYFSLQAEML